MKERVFNVFLLHRLRNRDFVQQKNFRHLEIRGRSNRLKLFQRDFAPQHPVQDMVSHANPKIFVAVETLNWRTVRCVKSEKDGNAMPFRGKLLTQLCQQFTTEGHGIAVFFWSMRACFWSLVKE